MVHTHVYEYKICTSIFSLSKIDNNYYWTYIGQGKLKELDI